MGHTLTLRQVVTMRLSGRRQSGNVQDRRGMRPGRVALGGGLGMIVLVVMALLFGVDPTQLVNLTPPTTQQQPPQAPAGEYVGTPHEEEMKEFVSVILATTEDVWHDVFQHNGDTYHEPSLVLFSGGVQSACGSASTAVGPFYCPVDQDVYLDLSFFDELSQQQESTTFKNLSHPSRNKSTENGMPNFKPLLPDDDFPSARSDRDFSRAVRS
jgi:predicted metalloprotease